MLRIVNIEVRYHDVILVIRGASMEVPSGRIVCLLGANGAGKTTTLKAISGLLNYEEGKISDGYVEFEGKRINGLNPEIITQMGIFQIMEGRRVLEHLTAEENLKAGALASGGHTKKRLETVYGYFPRLVDFRKMTAGYLSGGEQQQLVIGRALMASPKLMLMDEPSLGLSPIMAKNTFEIIRRINEAESIGVLLVEQNAKMALETASYGYVMENGRIVLDGSSDKLRENEDIREFYLGLSELGSRKSYRDVKHYKRRKRWL
ncbi:MAG: ABC transporter ATP-binding protein [Pseudomonadota bacterium]